MKVREIMTSGSLATATLDTTLEEIASMMKAEDVGAIPVLDDDEKLVGIITDRDIVIRAIAEGEDPTECTAEEILSEQLHVVEPEADLQQALELMSRNQIRRLPVVEENRVIGIISLGDVSVKSGQDEGGEVLQEVSFGVRQESGRGNRQEQSGQEGRGRRTNGGKNASRAQEEGSGEQSAGEQVAEEEAEHQRDHQDTSVRGARQMGGTRGESGQSGRTRNASQSRQSVTDDLVNVEGEEEPEFQNAGGGQARQRANKQSSTSRGRQESLSGTRKQTSARGRDSGQVRGEDAARSTRGNTQGITNRSARQENQRQQKVAPMRAEGKNPRGPNKRKAS